MTYDESVEYVHSLLTFGIVPGLQRIEALLCELGNPEKSQRFIHVAGTNGKGSVCTMISNALTDAGYKTGLFTSPYINDFRERFQINGVMVSKNLFAEVIKEMQPAIKAISQKGFQPTEFEVITAAAFLIFKHEKCDIAVLETGLGGTLDSTNVIDSSLVSVITHIAMDHMNILGDTIEEITAQKAGIIKENGTIVCYPFQDEKALGILSETAREKNNEFIKCNAQDVKIISSDVYGSRFVYNSSEYQLALAGRHQVYNALTAIKSLEVLRDKGLNIDTSHIKSGIKRTKMPARVEVLSENPLAILDGAHNIDGVTVLSEFIEKNLSDKKITLVIAMMQDKEVEKSVEIIAPFCHEIITTRVAANTRSMDENDLLKIVKRFNQNARSIPGAKQAVKEALSGLTDDGALIICGSLYLAGEIIVD